MTALLELKPGEKVLEVGTGSGYQAVVLAELGGVEVYTIEIIPELFEKATRRLRKLGYTKIHIKQGDGYYGWPEYAPFDGIIVTAAPDHLPPALGEQLAERGRLVIPIGEPRQPQYLWKFIKAKGKLRAYSLAKYALSHLPVPAWKNIKQGRQPLSLETHDQTLFGHSDLYQLF
jgi:protein-L-isoaspartate(D-aspartate) O-methyltransferase